jgi:hypothetical protein
MTLKEYASVIISCVGIALVLAVCVPVIAIQFALDKIKECK